MFSSRNKIFFEAFLTVKKNLDFFSRGSDHHNFSNRGTKVTPENQQLTLFKITAFLRPDVFYLLQLTAQPRNCKTKAIPRIDGKTVTKASRTKVVAVI